MESTEALLAKAGTLTREEAAHLAENTEWWRDLSSEEVARFVLTEPRLCCPMEVIYKAFRDALGRPVFTHEFVDPVRLIEEMEGRRPKRSEAEVISDIPNVMAAARRRANDRN